MRRTWIAGCVLACLLLAVSATPSPAEEAVYVKKATWSATMSACRAKYVQWLIASKRDDQASSFRPFNSGSMRGDGPARHVSVNVSGVDVIRLVTICEQGSGNCNIWGEPKLIAKDGSETRLGSLKPVSVRVGWGSLLRDKNWQNHPLQVADRKFTHGLWVHANSELVYKLGGKYERFEAWVGEDKDRAAGRVRFQVLSGKGEDPPAVWRKIAADFPAASGWLMQDFNTDQLVGWFKNRPTAVMEQSLIQRVLGQTGGQRLRDELRALVKAKTPPGEARWLDLYVRACRYRECAVVIGRVGPKAKVALEKELGDLLAADVPPADPRWAALRGRAWRHRELATQFEAIQHDIRNRGRQAKIADQAFRAESLILAGDRDPLDVVLRRTAALLADLKHTPAAARLADMAEKLDALQKLGDQTPPAKTDDRLGLFFRACELRRRIALTNPLLNFDSIVFIKRHRALYNHMCDQYYGMAQRPGGGLYVLHDAFGPNPRVRDVLADAVVQSGRLRGRKLSGGPMRRWNIRFDGMGNQHGEVTEGGSFLSPDLSYDGKTIVFAYVECTGDTRHRHHTDSSRGHWHEGRCYHIFKVNVDPGAPGGLVQLTDGTWNDFDPCWLPNGRIAFMTERRGGYLRCGRVCPTYTLYDMNPDGGDINCLSFHETNEWNPSVTDDGRIIYTRWDYVDRFGCTAHHPWITTLDGADSRAVHGNFAPRHSRPDMEVAIRDIPNSNKHVATAAPHHSQCFGSLVMINPDVPDDDGMAPLKRITPEVGFPESQGGTETYGMAWPLSEDYYLCVYDANNELRRGGGNYGIYLVDSFGNKELIYRDPRIACMDPIPLRPRVKPPVTIPLSGSNLASRGPATPGKPGKASIALINVYDSIRPWPQGTKITTLRVLQVLPMSVPSGGPPHQTGRRIALAGDSVVPTRFVLGTVPVEKDGSAHFTVPANVEMFFQALDADGLAVQSMRSATYLHDGERLVCAGCHEPKHRTPARMKAMPLAMRRKPSPLKADVDGSNPFSYPRLVQPALDRNCVPCHTKKRDKPPKRKPPNLGKEPIQSKWYASYNTLIKYGFTNYGENLRTTPGKFGAKASKLYQMLAKGHHDLKLSRQDLHRITLWLDCSSMFYGVYERAGGEAQLRGEIAKPTLE